MNVIFVLRLNPLFSFLSIIKYSDSSVGYKGCARSYGLQPGEGQRRMEYIIVTHSAAMVTRYLSRGRAYRCGRFFFLTLWISINTLSWLLVTVIMISLGGLLGCARTPADYRWLSSDNSILSVSAMGVVLAKRPGKATVKVTSIFDDLNFAEVKFFETVIIFYLFIQKKMH